MKYTETRILFFVCVAAAMFLGLIYWSFRSNYSHFASSAPAPAPAANYPGKAESIVNYWYQGTDIPGWSVTPPTGAPPPTPNVSLEALRQTTQQKATMDLVKRAKVPIQNIALVSWSQRTWMFNNLGCAESAQTLQPTLTGTPGWIFVFRLANDPTLNYIYHADQKGNFLFCQTQPA